MSHRTGLFIALLICGLIFVSTQDPLSNFISGVPEGVPGIDYPEYTSVPKRTSFTCRDRKPGFYADPDTRCQGWFWCDTFLIKHSFLCPNLTVFNQKIRGCDWWYNVDCTLAISQYVNNDELYQQSPEEKARETNRKEKELLNRQQGWKRHQQKLETDLLITADGTSVSSLNDADNDDAFTSTLRQDLILDATTPVPIRQTLPPRTRPPATLPPATLPPATLPPATLPPATLPPATLPPATLPPATLPPATLPPATFPPATFPSATFPPATFPPATFPAATFPQATFPPVTFPAETFRPVTFPPATHPIATFPALTHEPATFPAFTREPATLPPASTQPFTSPQWVPAIPFPASTPRAVLPPQARPPAPFFFRPIANAIPINFPTPPRTRRPPTTPSPVVTDIQQPPAPVTSTATLTVHQQGGVDSGSQRPAIITAPAPTVTLSGRRRRPQTIPPPAATIGITSLITGDLDPLTNVPLRESQDGEAVEVTTPVFGTTLNVESRRLHLTSSAAAAAAADFGNSPTASVNNQSPTFSTSNTPLRVHSSAASRSSFQPFPTPTTTVTSTSPSPPPPPPPPPPTTPPTTRIPPSTVTSTLDDITTQVFNFGVAFGSRIDGQASENVAQSTELPPSTTEAPRRRKFIGGDAQTFPPFPVTTFSPKTTAFTPSITSVIFNRRRGGVSRNITESTPPSTDDETGETAAATFVSTKLTKKVPADTSKPARTFPSFPVTTFRPSTEFGQRDDIRLQPQDDINELSHRNDDVTSATTNVLP